MLLADIMKELATADPGEKYVELLLLVFETSGFTLRREDPSSLRDVITLVQKCATGPGAEKLKDQ